MSNNPNYEFKYDCCEERYIIREQMIDHIIWSLIFFPIFCLAMGNVEHSSSMSTDSDTKQFIKKGKVGL